MDACSEVILVDDQALFKVLNSALILLTPVQQNAQIEES